MLSTFAFRVCLGRFGSFQCLFNVMNCLLEALSLADQCQYYTLLTVSQLSVELSFMDRKHLVTESEGYLIVQKGLVT